MRSVLFFIIPLFVARVYAIIKFGELPSFDMLLYFSRGFISDLMVGAVIGLVFRALYRRKSVYFPIWALWVFILSLNIEHIGVNSSNANFAFANLALASEFIQGSVFSIKSLADFIICVAFSVPIMFVQAKYDFSPRNRVVPALAGVCIMLGLVFIPTSKIFPYWMQMNFLEENTKRLFTEERAYFTNVDVDQAVLDKFFSQDLSGEPVIQYPAKKPNVLVVIVEGIAFDSVEQGEMPYFKKLADENLSYRNFIGLQRQTNRGVYSIVCGDYPNYLTREAKSDYVGMYGAVRKCLPETLKSLGYSSVFMQSADLGYMRKDKLAEAAGFDESMGNQSYMRGFGRNQWGVDDRTLYYYAISKVKELREEHEPWLLTLLTVGTHHPYVVPGVSNPTPKQAITYADEQLGYFIESLRREGLLENTLVVVTSDESSFPHGKGIYSGLSLHHIPLVVMGPGVKEHMVHEGLFTQADILLSIADYLGLGAEEAFGRSFFRSYEKERNLFFGSVYSTKIYSYSTDCRFYICTNELDCSAYDKTPDTLFDSTFEPADADSAYIEELKHALTYNELNSDRVDAAYLFIERNKDYVGGEYLLGDHKVAVKTGDRIIWNMKIKAGDPIEVVTNVSEVKGSDWIPVFGDIKSVAAGDTYALHKEVEAPRDMSWVWTKIFVNTGMDARYTVKELSIRLIRKDQG